MSDDSVSAILADAKLVANYGVRAGAFGQNETLFDAIKEAEALGGNLSWSSPQATDLQQALTSAIRTIYPVTMSDLNSGWRVGATSDRPVLLTAWQWCVKFVVVLSMAYALYVCASLTVWQQRATSLLGEMATDKAGQQEEAFEELFLLTGPLLDEQKAELFNPGSQLRAAFRQQQREIEEIERSILADRLTYDQLSENYALNDPVSEWLRSMFSRTGSMFAPNTEAVGEQPRSGASAGAAEAKEGGEPEGGATGAGDTPIEAVQPQDDDTPEAPRAESIVARVQITPAGSIARTGAPPPPEVCDDTFIQYEIAKNTAILRDTASEITAMRVFMSAVGFDEAFVQKVRCEFGPDLVRAGLSKAGQLELASHTIELMKARLDMMGLWYLPALYGALGALIFHLRAFLSSTRPDPTLAKVVIRVGLGAFAGIAIGWFWMPESTEFPGVPEITITPLTIAFLVGFAIDAFVAFLDRLVTLLNRWIGNLGAPA